MSVSVGNKKRKPSQMVSWASVIDTEALNHAQTIFRVAKSRKENSDEKMKEWDKTRVMEDTVTDSNTDLQCRVCMPEYSRWFCQSAKLLTGSQPPQFSCQVGPPLNC